MEAKLRGFGWFWLAWLVAFIGLLIILANLNCAPVVPDSPEKGAICMTAEVLDRQLAEAYSDGYQKAKAEALPRADVELKLFSERELVVFLIKDQCDRCLSAVVGEPASEACLDRAACLTRAARMAGYDSYGVVMNFTDNSNHAIVAFPLDNGDVIFVEPWFDQIVDIELGGNYLSNFPGVTNEAIIEKIGILW